MVVRKFIEKKEEFDNITKDTKSIYLDFDENDEYDKLTFPDWIESIRVLNYKYDLDNLPNSVVKLDLMDYENKIDNLPLSLKSLYITSDTFINSLDYLNEGLEELIIVQRQEPMKCLVSNLPSTLLKLKIMSMNDYVYDLNHLPNSLEELNLSCKFNLDNIPNNLKKIKISYHREELHIIEDKVKIIKNISPNISIELKEIEILYSGELLM